MRRGIVLLAAALLVPGPARADFHPACVDDVGGADATVFFADVGFLVEFGGEIVCDGADAMSASVRLDRWTPAGYELLAVIATWCSATCPATLRAAYRIAVPSNPAIYRVSMTFDAAGGGFTFEDVERTGAWLYPAAVEGVVPILLVPPGS